MTMIPSPGQQRALLVRHFLRQLFDSEIVPRQAEARVTLIQILALVATPGFVIMCILLRKYARLAPLPAAAAHLASLNERCLFIYFSMVVIGFVAVLQWDSLFPDRRDYLFLSPLPITERNLFVSKAASLCVFLALFSAFVNVFPAVLYPMFAGRSLLQVIRFIFSHVLSVFAGNAFVFFACIAGQGLLLNVLGPKFFVQVSRFVQLLLLIFLLSVFFLMPGVSYESLRRNPGFLAVFAPGWFLGLYETLLVGPSGEFAPLAWRALGALGLAGFGFLLSYVLAYKRQVRKTLDAARAVHAAGPRAIRFIPMLLHCVLLRTPGERAAFGFTARTLVRSQAHRTYFGAYLGVGLALVIMGLVTVFSRHGFGAVYHLRPELLSIPLVLGFFVLLGLRVVFSLPAHLPANWLFRLADRNNLSECLSGVRRAMFVIGILPLLALLFPLYLAAWGWQNAALHLAFCTILSLLLIELLLFRLDKIPFTCTYTPGKANLKLWWWVYLFGFTNYAYSMTELEQHLLRSPWLFVPFFAVSLALVVAAAAYRNRLIGRMTSFRYEADAGPAPEPLSLSYKPF